MSTPDTAGPAQGPESPESPARQDPRAQMKAALEAKKTTHHASAAGPKGGDARGGGPHGQQGGKRQFRRKAGG